MPIQLSGSLVITGSITTTGGITISGSILSASYSSTSDLLRGTGSVGFTTTASFNAVSSSQQQISTSLLNVIAIGATTGSNSFRANQSITGSLVVSSTITAQTLVVQTVTSSIVYSSGSNIFGSQMTDRQTFTGSIQASGSSTHFFLGGNVGIGTTSTSGVFEVVKATSSNINLANFFNSGSITGTENYMWIGKDGGTAGRAGLIDFIDNTDPSGSYLAFGIQGDNPKANDGLFVKKASKIGIGNNYPSRSLHVGAGGDSPQNPNNGIYVSNNGTTAVIVRDSTNHSEYTIQVQSNAAIVGTLTTHDLVTYTGNTERMRISGSNGYVGIGTTVPSQLLEVYTATQDDGIRITSSTSKPTLRFYSTLSNAANRNWIISPNGQNFGDFQICTSAAQNGNPTASDRLTRLLIDSAGNIGIGTATPINNGASNTTLTINGAGGNAGILNLQSNGTAGMIMYSDTSGTTQYEARSLYMRFGANNGEIMRLTNTGNVYIKNTSEIAPGSVANSILQVTNPNNDGGWAMAIQSNATTNTYGRGIGIKFNTDFNNSVNEVIWFMGGSVNRFTVESDGGIRNFSAYNSNLASDRRLKRDIIPLSTEWDKLKQIEVVNFKYKDSTDETALYGAIAQQIQEIYPELVIVSRKATETEPEYYGLREQPVQWLTTKVLQEAMAKIETLEAKVTALETK